MVAAMPLATAGTTPVGPRYRAPYIVTLRPGSAVDRVVPRVQRELGFRAERTYRHAVRGFSAQLTPAQVTGLSRDPSVSSVVEDTPMEMTDQILPPGIDRVEADRSPVADIDGAGGAVDVDIAIIDSGIQPDHPELNVVGGHDCSAGDGSSWGDQNGHGTHVAGIAAARDNGAGVVGVAPGARLWAVRVFTPSGFAYRSWVICGVDWVAGQRDPEDASRPLIEVANMSIRGPGGDDGECGALNDDALHAGICRAVENGVTMVVAAGNDRTDARKWVPASYDEAITVSALADFDGRPGGLGTDPCRPASRADRDDTFADFSNFGADVDLIAPGSCVYSTYKGSAYEVISGTSMASPTVAGGAALYEASHPDASPRAVRAALIAAGSQDWNTSSDPDGTHEPLLRVASFVEAPDFGLTAGPAWLLRRHGQTASYRVDVARVNGFADDVQLEVLGVPAGAEATFTVDPLSGPAATTSTLEVTPSTAVPVGSYTLTVRATSGTSVRSHPVRLVVDAAPASVAGAPRAAFKVGSAVGDDGVPLSVWWPAASGATRYQLQQSTFQGPWTNVTLASATSRSVVRTGRPGQLLQFRVRSLRDGVWGAWETGPRFTVRSYAEQSDGIRYAGAWSTSTSSSSYGGRVSWSTDAGATAELSFTGRRVTWVSWRGPSRGRAQVYIDGAYVRTVDLYASSIQARRLVFDQAWATSAPHTIRIRVLGTSGRPRVEMDGIIALR
jgi:hypothetical protein